MKVLLTFLGILVTFCCATPLTVSDISKELDCPGGCPRILDPVCGSDGSQNFKYFHNDCLRLYENCRQEKVWSPTQMSLCLAAKEMDPLVLSECMRLCPFIYEPVCATNGKVNEIFGNECVFGMENCLANGIWYETRHSDCGL